MEKSDSQVNRRSFMKLGAAVSGGLVLGFTWGSCNSAAETEVIVGSTEWVNMNAFLSIGNTGQVTIMSPNPEIGQNVKTSMPMIIAEELDVDWNNVVVEQAPLDTENYTRQVAGGSQSIRHGWTSLRTVGATAKAMLVAAAAEKWGVSPSECSVLKGVISNAKGEKLKYEEVAALASDVAKPEEVILKDQKDFTLIGTDIGNVDIDKIITGKPLFGLDTRKEGMLFASVLRPPAFGQTLKSFSDEETRKIVGVSDVIQFGDKVAVLAHDTWTAMKGKEALTAEWSSDQELKSTSDHNAEMLQLLDTKSDEPKRSDGNISKAMNEADLVFEKTYEAPFLPHNCLEPMNFFADVSEGRAELLGPIQTPQWTRKRVADLLEFEEDQVSIMLTRMGGGFGRRLYGDFALEAAEISKLAKNPVQLTFSREDDMTAGTYRPASKYKFRAAIKDGALTGYHLTGVGINMGNSTREQNWPAGCVENYLVESHNLESEITTGAWRAPVTNFLAFAEQAFFDELAEKLEKDPIDFRLEIFEKGKKSPTGDIEFDIDKSVGVIKLAKEKSNWGNKQSGVHQGFSTYYSHNTYVAEVAEVELKDGKPKVKNVVCAIDCGIVVNPIAALNQVEGGVVDGVGHAMYGDFSFDKGKPQASNFDGYRLIRIGEAPTVETHFVKSLNDPTGLGEPTLPPAGGALANAIHAATGERHYQQPFVNNSELLG